MRNEEQRANWLATRKWHHDKVLRFAVKVFNIQASASRHARLEHPKGARSWQTRAMKSMMARHYVEIDPCMYGLNVDGTGLNKKPTRIATTKRAMLGLSRKCDGSHEHTPLMQGRAKGAENYPQNLALAMSKFMMMDDRDTAGNFEDVYFDDEEDADQAAEEKTEDALAEAPTHDGEIVATPGH